MLYLLKNRLCILKLTFYTYVLIKYISIFSAINNTIIASQSYIKIDELLNSSDLTSYKASFDVSICMNEIVPLQSVHNLQLLLLKVLRQNIISCASPYDFSKLSYL